MQDYIRTHGLQLTAEDLDEEMAACLRVLPDDSQAKVVGCPPRCARSASASLSAALDQTRRDALPRFRCSKKQRRQLAQRYRAMHEAQAREAPELEAPLNMPLASSTSDLDLLWGANLQRLHTT